MAEPPGHQLADIVVGDVGDKPVLAEEVEQQSGYVPRVVRTDMMLANFVPVAASDIIEAERSLRRLDLSDVPLRVLTHGRFYFFSVSLRPGLGRAEKAMTSDFEVVLPIRRFCRLVDRQPSLRLRRSISSSRSSSVNRMRGFFLPRPMLTYFNSPSRTKPIT